MEGFTVINDGMRHKGLERVSLERETVWEDSELSTGCLGEKDLRRQERV